MKLDAWTDACIRTGGRWTFLHITTELPYDDIE